MWVSKKEWDVLMKRVTDLEKRVTDLHSGNSLITGFDDGRSDLWGIPYPILIKASEGVRLLADHFGLKFEYQKGTGPYHVVTKVEKATKK